ncbi:acyl-CoA dehydrogenase family protein [Falsiroseomonas selenitidurans]|uniref:Pimeloyl-CoA dehydrogenase large subunit n=1 Tax=Falsiroseomonas selenitidurans TaxID=2716335 RepID=A0ABX1E7Q7_9PROT|nr:acyl-CoA dehydrogenase family protein [Falsiroseomonas selenitidurans]NKC32775.1 pimeloyl-CoA dehydrogenase large subunit [Falsiroseomonas selenitidurans]OYW09650.1 MAG: pimeloyl-CoA dehydrogenase large subunit [Rhodospirillales bacterium 12-71-4]
MDLRYTPDEIAFRDDLRKFFRSEIPLPIRRKVSEGRALAREDYVTSQRILHARGLATPNWPVAWGGQDWTPVQRYIYVEELQAAAVPQPLGFNVNMVGPVIATFGSEAQKQRFLPATANLDIWWAQGFSEPGAGSDLASLKTTAKRDGDDFILNGQKTWTTLGQYADWIFCLVRTDATVRKQQGISFILADMKTPGISVRPIITIDGGHEVNEVFFDDVRVPAENLVGELNKGWDYAKFLLSNERIGIARIGMTKERLARVKRLAQETPAGEGMVWDDPDFRRRLAWSEIELKALEITQMRVVAAQRSKASDKPDPSSSILKIKGSEIQQQSTQLLMDVAGPYAMPRPDREEEGLNLPSVGPDWADAAAPLFFNYRKVSIYGGSNEIQRNIIAKAFLGL